MKLKKFGDRLLATDGLGEENKAEVDIELAEPCGNDTIRINGLMYNLQDGKRKVPIGIFKEKQNEIKVCSGGAWYVLDGLVRCDKRLVLDADYVARQVVILMLENAEQKSKVRELEGRLKKIEELSSGENFL